MNNEKMTTWARINNKLADQRRDWVWLREQITAKSGAKLTGPAVDFWRTRQVPAKHLDVIEDILGEYRGWARGEPPPDEGMSKLTEMARHIGMTYDTIPVSNAALRSLVFNRVLQTINQAIADDEAKRQGDPGSGKQSE